MASTRTSQRSDDGGRRDALVAAAGRLIAREGMAAATTRRIAQEAGLPVGLVHYWFAGKDELLAQVVQRTLADLQAAAEAAQRATSEPAGDLLAGLQAAFAVVQNDAPGRQLSLYELTTWALRTPHLGDLARAQYTAYRATATAGTTAWLAGTGAELAVDPVVFGRFIAVLFDGITLSWLADPGGTHPQEIFALVAALVTGALQVPAVADAGSLPAAAGA